MRRDVLRQQLFTRRAAILAGGQALLLAAIGGRMYQLQIVDWSVTRFWRTRTASACG